MLRARSSSILSCVQILTQHDLLLYYLHFWSCGHACKECIHILNDIVNTFRAEINKIYHWTTVVTVQHSFCYTSIPKFLIDMEDIRSVLLSRILLWLLSWLQLISFRWKLLAKPQSLKLPEENFVSSGLKVTTCLSSCLSFASPGAATMVMTVICQWPKSRLSGKSCPWWRSLIASSFPSLVWRTCMWTTWISWAWWPIQCPVKSESSWSLVTSYIRWHITMQYIYLLRWHITMQYIYLLYVYNIIYNNIYNIHNICIYI